MPEENRINTSRSADLVTHKILVDGEEVPAAVSVMNIMVEKEINRIPRARITMLDGDPASRDFSLSNRNLFIPGKQVEIRAGYHSDEETIFTGMIIKHALKIRSRQSFLIVECMDEAVKMTIGRKSRYFYDSSDGEILEQILDEYGLEHEVEETRVTHQELVQYNVTDWDFCITRAQANGKLCMADDGKLTFRSPDVSQAAAGTITYGSNLLDFDAETDARNQCAKVTSYGWNAAGQEWLQMEANDPEVDLNGNLSPDQLSAVIGLENLELKNGGGSRDVVLQEWADAKMLFNRMARVRGRMKFQGIPGVKPGSLLMLEGVGERFSGKVYVSAVRHQVTEGNWTVDVEFGINPKWFSETVEMNDLPAAGLMAAIKGLQIGIVSHLEGDPDGEDRIQVKLPVVGDGEEGIWARIASLDAGENRGAFFRPEIGDEVIVGFINESPNDAVVLGMMNSSAKPAPLEASDENHEKGFVTRSQMKCIFNDALKSFTLETPNGNTFVLSDDSGGLRLEDENGNYMAFSADGITLESANKLVLKSAADIEVESSGNITMKASAQFKAEGSGGAELSTPASAVVKGAVVQIN